MTDATIVTLQSQRDKLQAALVDLLKHAPPAGAVDLYGVALARAQAVVDEVNVQRLAALRAKLRDEYAEGLDSPPG